MSGFDTYNTSEKLHAQLEKMLAERSLPIYANKVSRNGLEKALDMPRQSLSGYQGRPKYKWAEGVVDKFEAELLKKEGGSIDAIYTEYGTPKRLESLLENWKDNPEDIPQKLIPTTGSSKGKLAIKYLIKFIGLPENSLVKTNQHWTWFHEMVSTFNDDVYGKTFPYSAIEFRAQLEKLYSEHRLPIKNNKISRTTVEKKLGIPAGCLSVSYCNDKYIWAADIVNVFEAELLQQEGDSIDGVYTEYGTPKRLQLLLEKWRANPLAIPEDVKVAKGLEQGRIGPHKLRYFIGLPKKSSHSDPKYWSWLEDMVSLFNKEVFHKDTSSKLLHHEDYSEEELIKRLNDMLAQRNLPVLKNKIARKPVEQIIGLPSGSLKGFYKKYKWAMRVVDEFEVKLLEMEGGNINGVNTEYGTPTRLGWLLDKWKDDPDQIPQCVVNPQGKNAGKISLTGLIRFIALPLKQAPNGESWSWFSKMVSEFNDELYEEGIFGTCWERKVPEIREYLDFLRKNRELPVNEKGTLNRSAIMKTFGFAENQSVWIAERRAPKLKDLFAEYDKIIVLDEYSWLLGDKYVDEVKKLLDVDDDQLTLNKTLREISIKWLAEKIDVKSHLLRQSPKCTAAIEARTAKLHRNQQQGVTKKFFTLYGAPHINLGTTPYSRKHDRVYSFKSLEAIYGIEFTEKVGTAFIAVSNGMKTQGVTKAKYSRIKHFLEWLSMNDNVEHSEVVDSLRRGKKPDIGSFNKACMRYRAFLLQEKPKGGEGFSLRIITEFGDTKVIPRFKFPSAGRNNPDRSHRPSIAEATLNKSEQDKLSTLLDNAAKYRDIEIPAGKDVKNLIDTLLIEKARAEYLPDDFSEAIHEISKSRLLKIRKAASIVFSEWRDIHKQANNLTSSAIIDTNEFQAIKTNKTLNAIEWQKYLKLHFPLDNETLALGNLLKVIKEQFNSTPPNASTTDGDQFWNKRYVKFGGIEVVAAYLMPTRLALSAALTLYLCESGANAAVALTLQRDCVRNSNVEYHKQIVGNKERAKGKSIYDDLPVKSSDETVVSAVEALSYIANCLSSPQLKAEIKEDFIALHFNKGRISHLTEFNFRSDFKSICDTCDDLKIFNLKPSMLRPTVLLNVQLEDPSNLGVAQMMAQHEGQTTTSGYTNKLPHRIRMEKHIHEFQNTLEIVMTSDDDEAHTKLGIDKEEWDKRKKTIQRTGWGVFCSDRIITDESGNESKCYEVESCVTCAQNRMFVSADPESVSEMIVWKVSLEKHEEPFKEKNIRRWEDTWVAWQAFFYVVLEEKMTRGKLSLIKKQGEELATERMNAPGFEFPEPW
jgi:hypothetical protein